MSFLNSPSGSTRSPLERTQRFKGAGGLSLMASTWGRPSSPPAVLLHGGGQTRHSWGGTGPLLAVAGFYAVALDIRGHGESDWASDGDYSWSTLAQDLRVVCESFTGAPVLVGASAGGLISVAATGQQLIPTRALVLVDIVLKLEPEGVRRIRAFMGARPEGFESLEEAADAVAAYLPGRRRPDDVSGLAKNLRRDADGKLRWHWDPRWLRSGDLHVEEFARLADDARRITAPTLVIRGGRSDVVSPEGVRDFLALVPHAEYSDVAEAGHMVAGDRNDVFASEIVPFLHRVAGPVPADPSRRPTVSGRSPAQGDR